MTMVLVGVLLVGTVGGLIWRNHASYCEIKCLNISRFEASSHNTCEVVSYFFMERINDINQLAGSRQVVTFFENQALGMSQLYGLRASKMAIKELFDTFIAEHRLAEKSIFDAIVLLDDQSRPLVLAGQGEDRDSRARDSRNRLLEFVASRARENVPVFAFDGSSTHAILGRPVRFKGEVVGSVWMRIPIKSALLGLLEAGASGGIDFMGLAMGQGQVVNLVGEADGPTVAALPPAHPGGEARAAVLGADLGAGLSEGLGAHMGHGHLGLGQERRLVVRTAVPGTPMDYLAIVPEKNMAPGSPVLMSAALSAMAVLCMVGLGLINNSRTRQIVLNTQLEEKSRAEKLLMRQAFHDQLTGLPNRLFMAEHLTHALNLARRNSGRVGVLFMDLDAFKQINDTLGHPAGDVVLCQAVERIGAILRKSDMLGRIGGDEFLLVLENVTAREILSEVADKVLCIFRNPFVLRDQRMTLGVSIGISMYPDDGKDADTLITNADMAMYNAKESGKNVYSFFKPELKLRVQSKMSRETELRHALAQEGLFLNYQPIVSAKGLELLGCETLVRLRTPDGQIVPPDEFIPVAEETGLICELDRWVLDTATTTARTWLDNGREVRLAVNISAMTLQRDGFVASLKDILARSRFPAGCLELEITETTLMSNVAKISACLDEIIALGVGIALDDFGTGYSSLYCLSSLPIGRLKIDRSFITGITERTTMVRAIIDMAEGLDLTVVAEGVETEEQLAILRNLDCDLVQGYLYSRPLDPDKFETLLRRDGRPRPVGALGFEDMDQRAGRGLCLEC